jgi:hypothetical protein
VITARACTASVAISFFLLPNTALTPFELRCVRSLSPGHRPAPRAKARSIADAHRRRTPAKVVNGRSTLPSRVSATQSYATIAAASGIGYGMAI